MDSPRKLVGGGGRIHVLYTVIHFIGSEHCLVGGPRVYQDQFRGFKSHRVHARRDFFLHKKNDWRKARERDLATFDEKSTSSGNSEPYARQKMKARTGGEKGRHL